MKIEKTNIRLILRLGLLAGLLVYVVVSLAFTSQMSDMRLCRGIKVCVADSLNNGFVTASELERELGTIFTEAPGRRLSDISLDEIERCLSAIDKIESVNATALTNDSIRVDVTPLIPVIRVFDTSGTYYVNSAGKRIKCDARYSMDVPVIKGNFGEADDPANYIELAQRIERDPRWRNMISMIEVGSPENIYLIPDIRGQVIAFGNTSNIENKLKRLDDFYAEVLPYKGWNHYDTLSVKWDGQIVATRARKTNPSKAVVVDEPDDNDYENLGLDELVDTTVLVAKTNVATPPAKPTKNNG